MTRLFHVTIRRVLTLAHVVSSAPETVPPHPSVPPLQVMESAHESGSNSTTCNDMQESTHRQVYLVWGRLDVPENLQLSQTLHVCHICLHWGGFGGQCRHICHTWSVWVFSNKTTVGALDMFQRSHGAASTISRQTLNTESQGACPKKYIKDKNAPDVTCPPGRTITIYTA